MLTVFVDASVVLELLLKRARTEDILAFFEQDANQLVISPLSVHLAYYFGLKSKINPTLIKGALQGFAILSIDAKSVQLAQTRLKGYDFEDCLQAAAAEQFGCDLIVTLDKNFSRASGTILKVLVL